MNTLSAAQRKIHDYIINLVSELRKHKESRLPTIARIASMTHCSPRTVQKVVSRLCREGILRARPRGGIHLVAMNTPVPLNAENRSAGKHQSRTGWLATRHKVENDIFEGIYPVETQIPSTKTLSVRYGVCVQTMHKVLASLHETGLLQKNRRALMVTTPHSIRTGSAIILVTRSTGFGAIGTPNPSSYDSLRYLELLCRQARVRLYHSGSIFLEGRMTGEDDVVSLFYELQKKTFVHGVFLWNASIGAEFCSNLIRRLLSLGIRTACLDEHGANYVSLLPKSNRLLGIFPQVPYYDTGLLAGRYLAQLGHRHVVFIDNGQRPEFSTERHRGVADVFASVGGGSCRFLLPAIDQESRFRARMRPFFEAIIDAFYPDSPSNSPSIGDWRKQQFRDSIGTFVADQHVQDSLVTTLGQENLPGEETAWVCCNDRTAISAFHSARMRGIDVPRRISIIGFDSSPESATSMLTTIETGSSAAISRGLQFLLGRTEAGRNAQKPLPILVERSTAASPQH